MLFVEIYVIGNRGETEWILISASCEFRSRLEEILPAEELLFDPTPGFGEYKPFLEHAIAHPAKMNTKLLEFLIKKFTKPGDTVLDPMAGSGSMGVVAALHGRNAVQVELEEKFCKWMEKARKNVEKHPTLTPKGRIVNILGDARRLSELLRRQTDIIVTSPPYSGALSTKAGGGSLKNLQGKGIVSDGKPQAQGAPTPYSEDEVNIGNLPHGEIDAIVTSPPYSECPGSVYEDLGKRVERLYREGKITKEQYEHFKGRKAYFERAAEPYPKSKGQIADLPHGEIDAVITSPPYSNILSGDKDGPGATSIKNPRGFKSSSQPGYTQEKTWTEKHKIDTVITSPPYSESMTKKRKGYTIIPGLGRSREMPQDTRDDNIANLKHGSIDTIITSPPYDNAVHCRGHSEYQERLTKEKSLFMDEYGTSKANIGNLKKETYLEAMLKVYGEMWKVLKPGGLAIIVIKPFIRNKKVVDLPYQTWLLLKKVGFKLVELYKLRLKNVSFWRVLYEKKYPSVPKLRHEYVLICQKYL